MRKLMTTVALGALTLFGAGLGYGQTLHRSFEITGYGGIRVYDDDVVFMDSGWVLGGKAAWFPHANIGVEFTGSYSQADILVEDFADDDLGDEFGDIFGAEDIQVIEVRLDAVYQFLFDFDQRVIPYLSAGVGQFVFEPGGDTPDAIDEPNTTFNWGGGIKWFLGDRFALRLDARDNVAIVERFFGRSDLPPGSNTKTFQANNPEFLVGLTIGFGGSEEEFGVRDSDFDGVPDRDDLCPNTPRGVIVDETGCPIDSDGDGVPDGLDACPGTPQGAIVDERGCPLDSDNDGVFDGLDQCPNTPAGVQVDETGCPLEEVVEAACLETQDWYTGDATINFDGRNWVKFGATQTAAMDQLTQVGEYQGVPIYVGRNAQRPYREVWLPLCSPADTYQPYRPEQEIRGTTGFIRDAN
ncbi:MAG TPA: outer membrane beta-barrel protein [Gemmatimonadota bacterium]|nr:outer membrane beta-barrel protein [Gemmatimonadota bacterium]